METTRRLDIAQADVVVRKSSQTSKMPWKGLRRIRAMNSEVFARNVINFQRRFGIPWKKTRFPDTERGCVVNGKVETWENGKMAKGAGKRQNSKTENWQNGREAKCQKQPNGKMIAW